MKRLSQLPKSRQLFAGPQVDLAEETAVTGQGLKPPALKHSFKTGFSGFFPALRSKGRAGLRFSRSARCTFPACLPCLARHGGGYSARSTASSQVAAGPAPATAPPRGWFTFGAGRARRRFPLLSFGVLLAAPRARLVGQVGF